jgi:hypothetical protein
LDDEKSKAFSVWWITEVCLYTAAAAVKVVISLHPKNVLPADNSCMGIPIVRFPLIVAANLGIPLYHTPFKQRSPWILEWLMVKIKKPVPIYLRVLEREKGELRPSFSQYVCAKTWGSNPEAHPYLCICL